MFKKLPCVQFSKDRNIPKPTIVPESPKKKKPVKNAVKKVTKADRIKQQTTLTLSASKSIVAHLNSIDSDLAQQARDPKVFRVTTMKDIYEKFEKDIIRPMEEVVLFAYWKPGAARTKKQYQDMMSRKASKPVSEMLNDLVVRLRMYKEENEQLQKECTQALVNKKKEEGEYKKILAQLRRQIRRTEHSNWNHEDENEGILDENPPPILADPRAMG